jgi:hypothetical protein
MDVGVFIDRLEFAATEIICEHPPYLPSVAMTRIQVVLDNWPSQLETGQLTGIRPVWDIGSGGGPLRGTSLWDEASSTCASGSGLSRSESVWGCSSRVHGSWVGLWVSFPFPLPG